MIQRGNHKYSHHPYNKKGVKVVLDKDIKISWALPLQIFLSII